MAANIPEALYLNRVHLKVLDEVPQEKPHGVQYQGWVQVPGAGAAKGGATGAMPPWTCQGGQPPSWLTRIKKHLSKDRMKIKENLKTCALKKVYYT